MEFIRDSTLARLSFVEVWPQGLTHEEACRLPLVLAIHGRGDSGVGLAGLAEEIGPRGYHWIFPNAPRELQVGYTIGYEWYDLPPGPQGEGIQEGSVLLESLLQAIYTRDGGSPARTAVLGFSQGAVMTLNLGLNTTQHFAALLALSGYLYLSDGSGEKLKLQLKNRKEQPILIIHGSHDPVLPPAGARRAHDFLRKAGLSPEFHEIAMEHEINREVVKLASKFLRDNLPSA